MSDPVRPLVLIAAVEALGVLAILVADVIAVLGGTDGLAGAAQGTAAVGIVLWVIVTGALALVWWGLYRRRALARTPVPAPSGVRPGAGPALLGIGRARAGGSWGSSSG